MQVRDIARRVGKIAVECKVPELDVDEYVGGFAGEFMEVAYAWARGSKFSEICKLTDSFEGSIIRSMRRLEEFMSQMAKACGAIGEVDLQKSFTEDCTRLRRDIIFAPSLYL